MNCVYNSGITNKVSTVDIVKPQTMADATGPQISDFPPIPNASDMSPPTVVVVVMMMPVQSVREGVAKAPNRIRDPKADQEQTRDRNHALADRLKQLSPEKQGEQTEGYGNCHVPETTEERDAQRPAPRPFSRPSDRGNRNPVVRCE